jgi:ABC-type amino acid transport substrate-binding protein
MMNFNTHAIVFGLLAGAASAVLAGSVLTQTTLAVVLFLLSAFPIIAAGLSFGPAAAFVGAVTAGVLVAAFVSLPSALVVLLITILPAALATTLVSLARPADEIGGRTGDTVWYPLADAVFYSAIVVAAGFVMLGVYTGYNMEFATEFARSMEQQFRSVNPDFAPSADFVPSLANFVYRAVPLIQPAMMVFALLASLYIALAAVRPSGRFARPADDWPLALRMPKAALPVFGVAMATSFFSGPIGLAATVLCGALGAGFSAAGFAVVHYKTRGRPARGLVLTLAYLAAFLFLPALFLFLLLGLFDTTRAAPVTRGPNAGPGQPPLPPSNTLN